MMNKLLLVVMIVFHFGIAFANPIESDPNYCRPNEYAYCSSDDYAKKLVNGSAWDSQNDFCTGTSLKVKGIFFLSAMSIRSPNKSYDREIHFFPKKELSDSFSFSFIGDNYQSLHKLKDKSIKENSLQGVTLYFYNGKKRFKRGGSIFFGEYLDKRTKESFKRVGFVTIGGDLSELFNGDFLKVSVDGDAGEYVIFENFVDYPNFKILSNLNMNNENTVEEVASLCKFEKIQ